MVVQGALLEQKSSMDLPPGGSGQSSMSEEVKNDAVWSGDVGDVRQLLDFHRLDEEWSCILLHVAAGHRHVSIMKLLKGCDINACDEYGNTPIYNAAFNGKREAVNWLLDRGCGVDTRNSPGHTPLHAAAMNNKTDVISCLVKRGGDVNSTDKYGDTPLHLAATYGKREAVRCLLVRGCEVDTRNILGETPLHKAAWNGSTEVISCLVKRGGDINSTDMNGDTPLHLAATYGKRETVRCLLDQGCGVDTRNSSGETPLHKAAWNGSKEVMSWLEMVKELIGRGCDVNAADRKGNTPLHVAAQRGRHGLMKTLVEAGGNVNSPGERDRTPLHVAVHKKKRAAVSVLLGLHADTECVDGDGKTARDLSRTKAITKLLSDQSTGGCNASIPINEQLLVNRKRRHDESNAPKPSKTRQLFHSTESNVPASSDPPATIQLLNPHTGTVEEDVFNPRTGDGNSENDTGAVQIPTSSNLSYTYFNRPHIASITPVDMTTSSVTSLSHPLMSLLSNASAELGPSSSHYIFSPSDINTSSVTSPSPPRMSFFNKTSVTEKGGPSVVRDENRSTTSYEEASHLADTQSSAYCQQSMAGNDGSIAPSLIRKHEDTAGSSYSRSTARSFVTSKLTTLTIPTKVTPEKGHVSSSIHLQDDDNNIEWDFERPNETGPLDVNADNRDPQQEPRTQERNAYIDDFPAASSFLPQRQRPQSAGDMHLIHAQGKSANMDGSQFPPDQIPAHSEQLAPDQVPAHSGQLDSDQVPAHSGQLAPDQIPAHSGQLAPDQLPAHSGQLASDQVPAHSGQLAPDQIPAHSGQLAPDQIPAHSGQLAPDQIPANSGQLAPDQIPAHSGQLASDQVLAHSGQLAPDQIPTHSGQLASGLNQMHTHSRQPTPDTSSVRSPLLQVAPDLYQVPSHSRQCTSDIDLEPTQPGQLVPVKGPSPYMQGKAIQPLQPDSSQLMLELTQLQAQCRQQAEEIRRLRDEKAQCNQCQRQVEQPPDTIRCLHPPSRPAPAETQVAPPLYERPRNPNHYQPTQGQRIPQCLYKILPAGQSAPQGYEQLAEGSAHNVVVPSDWMEDFRNVCRNKSPSYQLTKMVDGLYEPKELYKKKASSDLYSSDLGKALRTYAIDELKMTSSQVTDVLNSKITTVTRRCRLQPELLQ